jgi:hypothetical protein
MRARHARQLRCDMGLVAGRPFDWQGKPVYSFANVSSFAAEIVAKESQPHLRLDLPSEQSAPHPLRPQAFAPLQHLMTACRFRTQLHTLVLRKSI